MVFPLQQWSAPTGKWAYRPQTVNFGTTLTTRPVVPPPVVTPPVTRPPIVDPTRDPRHPGGGGGGGGGGDGVFRPSVVDKILNPLNNGINRPPLVHVGPPPLRRNTGLNPTITGVAPPLDPRLSGNFGTGPDGVLVHRTPALTPKVINQMGKTSLNPALTGILAGTKTLKGKTGIGPSGELVHKAPSPKKGTKSGKQTLSQTVFASEKMPASASGKNVIRAKQVTPKQQAKNQAANRAARLEEKRTVAKKPDNKPVVKAKTDTVFKNNVTKTPAKVAAKVPAKVAAKPERVFKNTVTKPKPSVQPKQAKPTIKVKAKGGKPPVKGKVKKK